ncbi:hypothetical protein M422DRAFT_274586 [Sphaerobolus stellatus SS14]|uniref:Uncharacterized protein n=1 Tax=Sphaerobolus stellatus (strain SS14) TaxID=990650 RepID=A0A0C9TRS4_SPHS4|nr:hypothetical protein M422DRAFT_274586 [Sphaerobolus stellatus SS14]
MSTFGRSQVATPRSPSPPSLPLAAVDKRPHGPIPRFQVAIGQAHLLRPSLKGHPLSRSFKRKTQRPPTPSPAPRTASPQPQLLSQQPPAPQSAPLANTGSPTNTDPTADIGRQLHGLFAQLTSTQLMILQELRANSAPAPKPPRIEPTAIPTPPPVAAAPEFLPPLSSNGNGESLRTYFPDIPEATLLAIWRNTFAARDLYKLDKEAKT